MRSLVSQLKVIKKLGQGYLKVFMKNAWLIYLFRMDIKLPDNNQFH